MAQNVTEDTYFQSHSDTLQHRIDESMETSHAEIGDDRHAAVNRIFNGRLRCQRD